MAATTRSRGKQRAAGRELMILWAGRRRRDAWDRMCDPYRQRIERQMPLTETIVHRGCHEP